MIFLFANAIGLMKIKKNFKKLKNYKVVPKKI